MNDVTFLIKSGKILLNEKTVAPLSFSTFKVLASNEGIKFFEFKPGGEWTTVGIDVNIQCEQYGMNISYIGNNFQLCWFDWGGGVSSLKGYNTSESELIADKNSLTKKISKLLCKQPEIKNYTNDMFLFKWGHISTSASIRSVIVSIGVVWTAENTVD